jgi:hypothetical protein
MRWSDPLNKIVWLSIKGWDETISMLFLVIPQNWKDKGGRQPVRGRPVPQPNAPKYFGILRQHVP